MKKILYYLPIIFCLGMLCISVSCSDDDDPEVIPVDLIVTPVNNLILSPGGRAPITIVSGNGDYLFSYSNEGVATATLSENGFIINAATDVDQEETTVFVKDRLDKTTSIQVYVAILWDLVAEADKNDLRLEVTGEDEALVTIESGNGGYTIEFLENSEHILQINTDDIEETGQFRVKAIAEGIGKIKLTDYRNQEVTLEFIVSILEEITISKNSILLETVQGSESIQVLTGGDNYTVSIEDPTIVKATVNGNQVAITGKMNGTTTLYIEDKYGQKSEPVTVEVNGPEYALNLSTDYFCHALFGDLAAYDPSVRSCEQVTFEMTCYMTGYRGLQTFMGLEGKLIVRGKNNADSDTHPIEIAGLNDNIKILTKSSFNLNEWMHIALVVDCKQDDIREKYKFYINGVQDELIFDRSNETHSSVDLTSSTDGNRFEIGRAYGQSSRAMNGTVSEARVWKTARSAEQIRANMCTLTETNPSGLLTRWNFTAGCATNYIQDTNGGEYETNLVISPITDGNYDPTSIPVSRFVEKGCP